LMAGAPPRHAGCIQEARRATGHRLRRQRRGDDGPFRAGGCNRQTTMALRCRCPGMNQRYVKIPRKIVLTA
jgi:hypothetical protein